MPAAVLLDEFKFSIDAQGRKTSSHHLVYRVLTEAGKEGWGDVSHNWEPWHEAKPALHARVISADGTVHLLDPKTITDSPAKDSDDAIFGDARVVRAPLPGVAPGAVVDEITEDQETQPYFEGGQVTRLYLGRNVPVQKSRVVIEYSNQVPLKYVTRLLPGLVAEKSTGPEKTTLTFEQGRIEAILDEEAYLPGDVPSWPRIEFSTGKSWRDMAEIYNRIVEEKVAPPATLKAAVEKTIAGKTDRLEIIRAINESLHKQVRYTGVEFAEAALIPGAPAETLKRKYGDCKDKSALLVSMLRAAGIEAHIALLSAGPGDDAEADLPGMGTFNHAIVYVPGSPTIWIDATAEFHRAGVLPSGDEGRLALVAAPGIEALQRIPESPSSANRSVETREFQLAELGKARVVETTEQFGDLEANLRSNFGEDATKEGRKSLEDYMKTTYLAEALTSFEHGNGKDFAKPFQIRLISEKAARGSSDEAEAVVAIFPSWLPNRLPAFLREVDDDENKTEAAKEEKRRKQDLQLPEACVSEWHYRIIPPPGFRPQPLPAASKIKLGPMVLEREFAVGSDGVVTANFRFDTARRRFTAAEVEQFKADYKQLTKAPVVELHFEQIGQAYLTKGKVREALVEFRRLEQLHPKEALHHSQVARALLAAGIGSAARKEAEAAVALEPTANAYYTLAQIREHDQIGRLLQRGYDRAGAEKAFRKAVELDSKKVDYTLQLAVLLEYNEDGTRYGKGSNLEEAAKLYRSVADRIPGTGFENNLAFVLFWAGKYADALTELDKLAPTQGRQALRLASIALSRGPEAALAESEKISNDGGLRVRSLIEAGSLLIRNRAYPEATKFFQAASAGAENSTAVANLAQILGRTKRHEEVIAAAKGPMLPLLKSESLTADESADPEAYYALFSKHILPPEAAKRRQIQLMKNRMHATVLSLQKQNLTLQSALDIGLATTHFSTEGDDAFGYRIRTQTAGQSTDTLFIAPEDGGFKIIGGFGNSQIGPDDVGVYVLARIDAGAKPEEMRRWLDWVREDLQLGSGDDPLAGPVFPRFWTRGQQGDRDAVRYAAAALAAGNENAERLLPVLQQGRAAATTDAEKANFDLALAQSLQELRKFAEQAEVAKRLLDRYPESKTAFRYYTMGLDGSHQFGPWQAAVDARLARLPGDEDALRSLRFLRTEQGDQKGSRAVLPMLEEKGKANGNDYNSAAWSTLFDGTTDAAAVERAERSNTMANQNSAGVLHTLAAVYAEVGKTAEARNALLRAMDLWGLREPDQNCWYVFGRLAEVYGLDDAAMEYYRNAPKPEFYTDDDGSSYSLAQRRLKALQARQQHRAAQVAAN